MTNVFEDQKDFQTVFQGHLSPTPIENYRLYRKLIAEELGELDSATSPEEHLDALIDLIYVTVGAGIALGHDMEKAWREVHRTNMNKLPPRGKPIIREDGKVVKPEGWEPPKLAGFVGQALPELTPNTLAHHIHHLHAGKQLRRLSWPKGTFLVAFCGGLMIRQQGIVEDPLLSAEDLLAIDWVSVP